MCIRDRPETVLIYNADDPLCASIADRAGQLPGREGTRSIAFGVAESMEMCIRDRALSAKKSPGWMLASSARSDARTSVQSLKHGA